MQRFPLIVDTTLRDGEQAAGVGFHLKDKLRIARTLVRAGVRMIEGGIPAMGRAARAEFRALLDLDLPAEIIAWNRLREDDLQASLDCGASIVHFSVPVSSAHVTTKLNRSESWILEEVHRLVQLARSAGLRVSLGTEDASRADQDFVRTVLLQAQAAGAERVRYADTVGSLTPERTRDRIGVLAQALSVPLEFHGHNDFGLAVANSIAALHAGAAQVSCCVLGLGERAGNTSLEQLVLALEQLYGQQTGINPRLLRPLARLVGRASGEGIAPGAPIVGSRAFAHESGIHVHGVLRDPALYEPFPPETVGRRRRIVLGKHSGTAGVAHQFSKWGAPVSRDEACALLDVIRNHGERKN